MDQSARKFLHRLLETPSPSSMECPIQMLMVKELAPHADVVEHDLFGNVFFGLLASDEDDDRDDASQHEGRSRTPTVMIEAHADQIGFLVRRVSEEGFIYVEHLGGVDEVTLPGSRVVFVPRRRNDGLEPPPHFDPTVPLLTGVFCKKATHVEEEGEDKTVPTRDNIWIDIGATSKEEAEKLVRPGDYATYELRGRVLELENQRIVAPGLDDKAGLWAVAEAFKRLAADRGRLQVDLWAVCSVQEEVGLRGVTPAAYSVNPTVALAVDVVNATDDPAGGGSGENEAAGPCVLGKGPTISGGPNTNPVVAAMLRAAAGGTDGEDEVPYQQLQTSELEGNDSKTTQTTRRGVAVASVGIPNRAMHTQVEVCHLRDLEQTAELLVRFVRSVTPDTDFRPLRIEHKGSRRRGVAAR